MGFFIGWPYYDSLCMIVFDSYEVKSKTISNSCLIYSSRTKFKERI